MVLELRRETILEEIKLVRRAIKSTDPIYKSDPGGIDHIFVEHKMEPDVYQ